MLLTFVLFASVVLSKSCARPSKWCSHRGSKFEWKDCDGDGIKDPVCSDKQGRYGWIPSAGNCKDNWTKVKKNQCQTCTGKNCCAKPKGFCTTPGSKYSLRDCDGDGVKDHVCSDDRGNYGVVQTSKKCANSWPNGKCKACDRPSRWCSHKGSKYQFIDADGDGTKDHTCSDSKSYGVIQTKNFCKDSWPNGKRPSKCGKWTKRETGNWNNWFCDGGYKDLKAPALPGTSGLEKCLELCSEYSRKKGVKGCCERKQDKRGTCEFHVGGKAKQWLHSSSKVKSQISTCDGTRRRMEVEGPLEGLSEQLALDIGTDLE